MNWDLFWIILSIAVISSALYLAIVSCKSEEKLRYIGFILGALAFLSERISHEILYSSTLCLSVILILGSVVVDIRSKRRSS